MDRNLRLNDLLLVGTHNSYKQRIPDAEFALIAKQSQALAQLVDYGHPSLPAQLDAGTRQLEIDVYYDPQGGLFAHPLGPTFAGTGVSPQMQAALAAPGFKVLHIPDVDFRSSCLTLVSCLEAVRGWSEAHPRHAPIMLMFNIKTDTSPFPAGVKALPFTPAAADALDAEIRSVFASADLVTPDDVQGAYPTLREAVLHDNWPRLGEARGKLLLAMDEGPDKVAVYRGDRRSLEGRVFFINTDEASPAAAYLTLNDPVGEAARIAVDVKAGFLVRTRADGDTKEARVNDTRRRDAALAGGAQYVSTDYMRPDPRFAGGYRVGLAGGAAALCNPQRMGDRCAGTAVEAMAATGYLGGALLPHALDLTLAPPRPGSAEARADLEVFAKSRRLEGGPRWRLAQRDVTDPPLTTFACALGVQLKSGEAPAVERLLERLGADRGPLVDAGKFHYRAKRPYQRAKGDICEAKTEHLAGNPDFPSGHAAAGWSTALVLAELLPERAPEILIRGRAFMESRVACGSHSLSAVEAASMLAAALVAAEHGSVEFRGDADAARRELQAARDGGAKPDPAQCRAEAEAIASWRP